MPHRLLVIGDDAQAGLALRQSLAAFECDAWCYDDVSAALRSLAAGQFDTVLIHQTRAETVPQPLLRQIRSIAPSAAVVIVSRHTTVDAAVAAMKEGAADYLPEPATAADLCAALDRVEQEDKGVKDKGVGNLLSANIAFRAAKVPGDSPGTAESEKIPDAILSGLSGFHGMLGRCPALQDVFGLIERIAPTDSTVLVCGESGTGKEMAVRAIHRLSRRSAFPLLACDCTALAPTLLESELFGHVKGSFSGAIATKQGLFEAAHQGTLFLDEVANLSLETQGKLLRVLETRRLRKVGDTAEHDVDIRLIATTNRGLAELVKIGAFRADLYYRLNVVPVLLPPLRERVGDIPLLAAAFLEQFARLMHHAVHGLTDEAMWQLEVYRWPGNVRELRNIVERLAVLYGGTQIEMAHLPPEIRAARPVLSMAKLPHTWDEFKRLKRQVIQEMDRRFLLAALERGGQNITQAAESVGMQRTNFHAMMRCHALKVRPEPPPEAK